jgi:hypothetical protein
MKLAKIIVMLLMVMVTTTSFAARGRYDDTYDQGSMGSAGSSSKFYLGAGLGSMKTDIPTISANALAWSLYAGTAINRNLAIEVAYTNLGSTDLGASQYLKGTTYSLNLVGNIPVTQIVSMFAKFGFANTGVYVETSGAAGTTYSNAAPTIGLGVMINAGKKTDVRIAYDNYKFILSNTSPTYNADITSISLIYKF